MLDTHAVARSLTEADFTPAQADAITSAVLQATERGDHVTADQFRAGIAELRTEITAQRAEAAGQISEIAGQVAEQRAEIAELRAEQRTDIATVRTEIANLDTRLSTQVAEVRTEIATLETRLIKWMVGTVLTTAVLTFGILRFITP